MTMENTCEYAMSEDKEIYRIDRICLKLKTKTLKYFVVPYAYVFPSVQVTLFDFYDVTVVFFNLAENDLQNFVYMNIDEIIYPTRKFDLIKIELLLSNGFFPNQFAYVGY